MKKIIAMTLALVLLLSAACVALADTKTSATEFDPKLAGAMNYDADKWMSTDLNRSMLTILLFLQLTVDKTFTTDDFSIHDSMVAEKDGILTVALLGQSRTLIIVFAPIAKYASWMTFSTGSKSAVEKTLKDTNTTVYTNTDTGLKSALEILQSVMNSK